MTLQTFNDKAIQARFSVSLRAMPGIVRELVKRNSHDDLDKIIAFDLSFPSEQFLF